MKTKKKVTRYTNYDKFEKKVGLLDEEALEALGWKCDNGNRICFSKIDKLLQFMEKLNNPSNAQKFIQGKKVKIKRYHIATDLDAGSLEDAYCEKKGIEEDDGIKVVATNIVNYIAYVNRMDYYLCDGDDNLDLYLEEVEEI